MAKTWIIGIDEVGRGALAGPVTVGAAALRRGMHPAAGSGGLVLRDSKKLSPCQRENWVKHVKNSGKMPYTVASVSAKRIDGVNVTRAANIAAGKALRKLVLRHRIDPKKAEIYLDGGLFLPPGAVNPRHQKFGVGVKFANARTVIKGDEKIPAISLASIVAKVHRDRLMVARGEKFPRYEFARHKGYGTRAHIRLVKKYGLSEMHRKTFCKFV